MRNFITSGCNSLSFYTIIVDIHFTIPYTFGCCLLKINKQCTQHYLSVHQHHNTHPHNTALQQHPHHTTHTSPHNITTHTLTTHYNTHPHHTTLQHTPSPHNITTHTLTTQHHNTHPHNITTHTTTSQHTPSQYNIGLFHEIIVHPY